MIGPGALRAGGTVLRHSLLRKSRVDANGLARRFESTHQTPAAPTEPPNRHRQYYRNQGAPVLKAILIAITTQQLLYWGWLKLESLEIKSEQDQSVRDLQNEIKQAVQEQRTGG